jgi:uncharacterized protein YndB with AHSA1/START domain
MFVEHQYADRKKIFADNDIFLLLQIHRHLSGIKPIAPSPQQQNKMSKQLYTLEYPVRSSAAILYEFLSTPAGLQEWFAEKVDERDGLFSFTWNGSTDQAEMLESEENRFVRFRWLHAPAGEYFEFSIEKSEVSNQTILVIKDFAEKKEIPDQKRLWDFQVNDLFHRIGS